MPPSLNTECWSAGSLPASIILGAYPGLLNLLVLHLESPNFEVDFYDTVTLLLRLVGVEHELGHLAHFLNWLNYLTVHNEENYGDGVDSY